MLRAFHDVSLDMKFLYMTLTWSGPTMPPSRHSVGTSQELSTNTTCQVTLSHSHLGSLSHSGLSRA